MGKSKDIRNARVIDQLCNQFEQTWSADQLTDIGKYLKQVDSAVRPELLHQLMCVEFELRVKAGQLPDPSVYRHLGDDAVALLQRLSDGQSEKLKENGDRSN